MRVINLTRLEFEALMRAICAADELSDFVRKYLWLVKEAKAVKFPCQGINIGLDAFDIIACRNAVDNYSKYLSSVHALSSLPEMKTLRKKLRMEV